MRRELQLLVQINVNFAGIEMWDTDCACTVSSCLQQCLMMYVLRQIAVGLLHQVEKGMPKSFGQKI